MEFTINKENTDKLKELTKVCQSVADMTILRNLYVMSVSENTLKAIAYGNGNILQFSVDIENFSSETPTGYFYIDILQFIQAIEKVYAGAGSTSAKVSVVNSKLTVSQGKSKIVVNMFDDLSTDEYIEADNSMDLKLKSYFETLSEEDNLKVTSELMGFSDAVGKFITMMNRNNVSGFSVENNNIYYSDQSLTIMRKKLSYEASKKPLFISVDLFNFLSNLAKVEDYTIEYAENDPFIHLSIPTLRLEAILAQPEVIAVYPNAEEFAAITATEDNKFSFSIDIPTLLSKCDTFDGIFPAAQWKWKTVDFNFDSSNPDIINLYHSSDTAEVDTDLPIISSTCNSTATSVSFKVTTLLMCDYLSKFMGDSNGKVNMEVSPLSVNEDTHGIGIKMTLVNDNNEEVLMLTLSKIYEEEVY